MSTLTTQAAPAPAAGRARRGPRRAAGRLRARAATTPGLLRILSLALVAVTALLWVASFATVLVRQDAVRVISGDAGPSFIAAQRLHADLSEADAAMAEAFLAGGVEPPAQRVAYTDSIASATSQLAILIRAGGPVGPEDPLGVLSAQIPVYTGLVGQARANNRQGLAIGTSYLLEAALLMRGTVLPNADRVALLDAARIDDQYRRATDAAQPALVAAAGAVTLVSLAAVQVLVYRRTRRVLNPPMVAASVLAALVVALVLASFSAQRARLLDARDHGFVPMTEVAQAQVLALRVWRDDSLSLIARGDGAALDADAATAAARLGYDAAGRPTGAGVLPSLTALGGPDAATHAALEPAWRDYQATSIEARRRAEDAGAFHTAVQLALGDGTAAFRRYDAAADVALTASQDRFHAGVTAAGDQLAGRAAAVSGAAVLAAALSLTGLQRRINEYR